jgi:hypothetical protein
MAWSSPRRCCPGRTVSAHCQGFQSRDSTIPITITDKDITGLVWEVDGGARIRGKVVTKTGEPVEDASITAQTVGGAGARQDGWSGDSSARDGAYELAGLKPGSYKLEVSADRGIAPKDGYKVDVVAGATVDQDLVLDDGGTIKGTVVDSEGKPVSGVSVRAWPVSGGGMRFMSWGDADNKSDEAGAFSIDSLRPGDYRVMAQRGWRDQLRKPGTTDDAKQGEKVSVRANQAATVKLVVESQSGTIKGTVVDAEGKPVADAFVSAARESDAAGSQKTSVQETRWSWDERPNLTSTDGYVHGRQAVAGQLHGARVPQGRWRGRRRACRGRLDGEAADQGDQFDHRRRASRWRCAGRARRSRCRI